MTFPTELERLKHAGWPAHASAEVLRNHATAILELVRAAEATNEWFYKIDATPIKRGERDCLEDLKEALNKLNGGKG